MVFTLAGRYLTVLETTTDITEPESRTPSKNFTVFVSGLDPTMNETDVAIAFEKYGDVVSIGLPLDPDTGLGRGCGFVKYFDVLSANQAIARLSGRKLHNRVINVESSGDMATYINRNSASVYMSNLSSSVTPIELNDLFKSKGFTVERLHVTLDREKICNCLDAHAFVKLSNPIKAQEAAQVLNKHMIGGREIAVHVSDGSYQEPITAIITEESSLTGQESTNDSGEEQEGANQ